MAQQTERVKVGSRRLELSNLDKVFYPATGFTKGDVISYYRAVSAALLPHLRRRAVTLKRYPNGVEGPFFYEKECPSHRPGWVTTVAMRRKRDSADVNYCLLNTEAALVWAANLANLELHVSLARAADTSRPASLVFDLDPGAPAGVIECGEVALEIREFFSEPGLETFVKTSGSKGLQAYVPLNSRIGYEHTRSFAHAVATNLAERAPDRVTSTMKKEDRIGKVFVDWSQNDRHKTTVSVYSLRAKERPTASTPVTWDEVEDAVARSDPKALTFEAEEVIRRIERYGDLFEPVLSRRQRLPKLD